MVDLLAKRWANPFFVLDEFVRLGGLYDFLTETFEAIAEENVRRDRWEYYTRVVAHYSKMTFDEYVKYCEENRNSKGMTAEDIVDIISDSKKLLEEFK